MDHSGNVTVVDSHGARTSVIEDANGNYGDTTHRTAYLPALPTSQTETFNVSYSFNALNNSQDGGACNEGSSILPGTLGTPGPTNVTATKSMTLANGQQYSFQYDPVLGLLNKITYPTGATVTYTWSVIPNAEGVSYHTTVNNSGGTCSLQHDWFAITKRVVSFDGVTNAEEQDFAYNTVWPNAQSYKWTSKSTTVTTKDLIKGTSFNTIYNYLPARPPAESDQPTEDLGYVPVENTIQYYDTNGTLLKTITKSWATISVMAAECETLPNGQISGKFYSYAPYAPFSTVTPQPFNFNTSTTDLPTDVAEYDYGQVATACVQPGSWVLPTRETVTTYQTFPAGPLFPYSALLDRPSTVKVYGVVAGAKTLLQETDYAYDAATPAGVSPTPYGHDETNYGSGSTAPRGNPTTVTKKCFVGSVNCTNSVINYAYDTTGQILTVRDANLNTTTYSYADNYTTDDGSPPPNYTTNAFVTKITRPSTNGVSHITRFQYGFNDGKLRVVTDENNLLTTYCYWTNGCTGTSFDPFVRLTGTIAADGGQATTTYNDTALTVANSKQINTSQTLTTVALYDGLGHSKQTQLTSDPQGTVFTDTKYDGLGRVYTVSNPYRTGSDPTTSSGTTTYIYDALNRKCVEVPPDGTLPTGGVCPSTQPANDLFTSYSNNCTTVTDETGKLRRSCTDALGRLIEVDEPTSSAATAGSGTVSVGGGPDQSTTVTYVCGPNGQTCQRTVYDGGTITVTVNNFAASASYYQASSTGTITTDLITALNASGSPVTASPSGSGITITANTPGSSSNYSVSISVSYDSQDFSHASFTASGPSSLTGGTDSTGSLTIPAVTLYTYDALGNLLTVTQKGGSTNSALWRNRTFTYDSLSRLLTSTNPEVGTITYKYDADTNCASPNSFIGLLVSKTDARGIRTCAQYDALNRETVLNYSNGDPTVTTAYDQPACLTLSACQNIGHRTSMIDAAGSEAWAYQTDATNHRSAHANQRTTISSPSNITKNSTYYFDIAGNVTQAVYPTGRVVNYTFNAANHPITAADSSNGITYASDPQTAPTGCLAGAVCYTPQGTFFALSIGQTSSFTGLNLTHSYNTRLQPLEFKASSTGGNAMDISYNFNLGIGDNGRVFGITNNIDNTRSQSFAYDALNRITSALTASTYATSPTHCWGETYTLDAWANLQSISATSNSNYTGCTQESGFSHAADGNNHLAGFTYDAAGNTSSDTVYSNYVWDGESQLKSVNGTSYAYDGDGRRVAKVGSKLYWYGSGGEILAETNAAGATTAEYIFFGGKRIAMLPASSTPIYYVEDLLGSSRVTTTNTGVVCYDADFYPYGGERAYVNSCLQNNYKFEGKERDTETGNDDFGARYYSNRFGRWLSADWSSVPVAVPYANLTNPQTLNLYAMVADDPESFADLDGHYCNNPNVGDGCGGGQVTNGSPVPAGVCASLLCKIANWLDHHLRGGNLPPPNPESELPYNRDHSGPSKQTPVPTPKAAGAALAGTLACQIAEPCGIGEDLVIGAALVTAVVYLAYNHFSQNEQSKIKEVAREKGVDRKQLGKAVEQAKKGEGRGGADNLSLDEIRHIADEIRDGGWWGGKK